jgi:phytoene desaturase
LSKTKTVAIIGGGVSGLSAGGLLARQGLRVKLFEANDKVGGCCANTNVEGYSFDDGALCLVLPGVLDRVFERLGMDRVSILPLRKIIANQTTILPDGSVVTIGDRLAVTVKNSGRGFDHSKLERELVAMQRKWEPVLRIFAADLSTHPLSYARILAKSWRHLPKLRGSVASEINRLFGDESVRAAMSGALLYAGSPPQKTPVSQILGLVARMTEGYYLPEGGMGKIPQALNQCFLNRGGEIFLNSKVRQIILKDGRVRGIQVDGQGEIEADAVISTVSGMLTFGSMIKPEEVPANLRQKARRAPLAHKALCIQLGLSNRIDADSFSNGVLPMIDKQLQFFAPEDAAIKWFQYFVPTSVMPELAPRGGSIIDMFPPIRQDLAVDDWNEQRTGRMVESAIAALSRLHKLEIVVKRVTTPKDYRDRMHLYQSAIYGLSPAADPRFLFPHNPPIPGLFLAGQTTFPGYGVVSTAMSGIFAADDLMKKTD